MTPALEIAPELADPRQVSAALVRVTDQLGLLNAELARILRCQCGDIGRIVNAKAVLEPGSEQWGQALELILLYQLVYQLHDADGVAMRHWLRVVHPGLGTTPFLAIVDEDRLEDVVMLLKTGGDG